MRRSKETHVITTIELAGNCMLLLAKVLKSFLFNALIFILGFGVAYVYVVTIVHIKAHESENYEFILQIKADLQQLKELCNKIEALLNVFKLKSSHDVDPICDDHLVEPFISNLVRSDHR